MSQGLSVIIPCKNERRNLDDCVASARLCGSEIIVADNGSTDGSLELARRLGCRVISREFVSYANFKNWAIPQARHEWVLILDADERVTPELAAEIQALLARGADCDAYRVRRDDRYFACESPDSASREHFITRLIRRDRCRYKEMRVHEEIDFRDLKVGKLRSRMLHFTAPELSGYVAKRVQYAMLGGEDAFAQGKRCSIARMLLHAPLRFFQLYFLSGGFRNGRAGLVICAVTAFYAFLKDARLWEMQVQAELEAAPANENSVSPIAGRIEPYPMEGKPNDRARQARAA